MSKPTTHPPANTTTTQSSGQNNNNNNNNNKKNKTKSYLPRPIPSDINYFSHFSDSSKLKVQKGTAHCNHCQFSPSSSSSTSSSSNAHPISNELPMHIRSQHAKHHCAFQNKSKNNSLNITPHSAPTTPHKMRFNEYLPLCELQKGLKKGEYIEGTLRINPKSYEDAYISAPDGGRDIYIQGMHDRNRALNSDVVCVKLKKEDEWKMLEDGTFQKVGEVVGILEKKNPRVAGGYLKVLKDDRGNWALFAPRDSRIPRLMIPKNQCPSDFFQHPGHYSNNLFIAKVEEWKNDNNYPLGTLQKFIGKEGDIEAETEMILSENGIDYLEEFPKDACEGLPIDDIDSNETSWTIPDSEFSYRRNFTNNCVFTIDPSTARDLDDALSIEKLSDDSYEIGVHIADVSYFVKEGMKLDEIARERCTSVYLVHKVIPMLPRVLCEKLCSLNPGEDKLTFSVVFNVDQDGEILNDRKEIWFGRTIINSCIKLSYELAQDMIDEPFREWKEDELPQIHGKWKAQDISYRVNQLNEIAKKIRNRRFENGSLKIDKLKLHFTLDKETGFPSSFSSYTYRDSNRLIEEFMLMANIAVSERLHVCYKKSGKAFLRSHPAPDDKLFKDFRNFCKANNFIIDTSTSGALERSLRKIIANNAAVSKVVAHYLLKSMNQAIYIVSGMNSNVASYHHYALNVPLYTHFTSPIRRYADIIVHRSLAASLGYEKITSSSVEDLFRIANKCNLRKQNARIISEASAKIFLFCFIKNIGKMEDEAVVVSVFDHSFDVMLLKSGLVSRIYLNKLAIHSFKYEERDGIRQLLLQWKGEGEEDKYIVQTIKACQILNVIVSINPKETSKLNTIIQSPNGAINKSTCTKVEECSLVHQFL